MSQCEAGCLEGVEQSGVGKSVIAVHLAHYLRDIGKSVLVIDLAYNDSTSRTLSEFTSSTTVPGLFDGKATSQRSQREVPRIELVRSNLGEDKARWRRGDFGGPLESASARFREGVAAFAPHFDYCVVDTAPGGREDAEGWTAWNTWLLAQKRKGRTVIVVHHTGKNGDQRGTSKREDSLDFVIGLKPGDNEEFPNALSFNLEWTKSRHLKREQASRIRATLISADENESSRWVYDAPPSPQDRVAEARALSAGGLNQTQIAERLGVNKSSVCRMLKGGGGHK